MARSLEYFISTSGNRLHTELSCVGLERTPISKLQSVGDLGLEDVLERAERCGVLLCRVCALEITLDRAVNFPDPTSALVTTPAGDICRDAQPGFPDQGRIGVPCKGDTPTLVLFTAQPAWQAGTSVSHSGQARMARIAARMGVLIAGANCGPTAVARIPAIAAAILARNLRTFIPTDQSLDPVQSQGALFWSAVNERTYTDDAGELTSLLSMVTRIAA